MTDQNTTKQSYVLILKRTIIASVTGSAADVDVDDMQHALNRTPESDTKQQWQEKLPLRVIKTIISSKV